MVTKDLRQSTAVPNLIRSVRPFGGKYCSHLSGSVKLGISSSVRKENKTKQKHTHTKQRKDKMDVAITVKHVDQEKTPTKNLDEKDY